MIHVDSLSEGRATIVTFPADWVDVAKNNNLLMSTSQGLSVTLFRQVVRTASILQAKKIDAISASSIHVLDETVAKDHSKVL